jgi:hypothetical protein
MPRQNGNASEREDLPADLMEGGPRDACSCFPGETFLCGGHRMGEVLLGKSSVEQSIITCGTPCHDLVRHGLVQAEG